MAASSSVSVAERGSGGRGLEWDHICGCVCVCMCALFKLATVSFDNNSMKD